ncbi:TCR/Tet family MFS transporter [Chitinophaga pendula]|uniref:TCR/Tet family MFS transporter n=1 Tax=Chitinophaga TaxID=79328 RepID=UPI000BB08F12|nr:MULTISPECIES: TCR/Tet family MFS transporter [Chitinophaga]ASZ12243.1 tetracycline resistance MFS efflux pump [Chitinophaga sp. MD30]UCJ04725.1 TCR/Tet family MFS transporter [Chitinophaga pendula]
METSAKARGALGFIFITLFLDVMGLGIIIPVFPKLIERLIHGDLSAASRWSGLLIFVYAIAQFIFAPVLGNLSDRYGRRPVLLCSLLGFGLDYIFMAFAPTIGWLFVSRLLAGITGASFTTASAYIADISTPEKRAQNFGLIGAAFGLGFIFGPVIGGVLVQFGDKVPFLTAASLTLLNVLYGFFILPESLPLTNRRAFDWKRANPVGALMQLKKYPAVYGLLITLITFYMASTGIQSTWTYYCMAKFNWNETWVGYSLGFSGLMTAFVQLVVIRIALPKLGQEKSVYLGLTIISIGLFLLGMAAEGWMMFAILVPYAFGNIAGPALSSFITGQVPPNEQGELQGALTSLMSATGIISPLIMTNLFAYFTQKGAPVHFPGAPFVLCSILVAIGLLFARRSMGRVNA